MTTNRVPADTGTPEAQAAKPPAGELRQKSLQPYECRMARYLGYGVVYFIAEAPVEENAPCKVGFTFQPETRLSNMQTSSPRSLVYADMIFVKAYYDHMEQIVANRYLDNNDSAGHMEHMNEVSERILHPGTLESELHQLYEQAGMHLQREWFMGGARNLALMALDYLKESYPDKDYLSYTSFKRKIKMMQEESGIDLRKERYTGKRPSRMKEILKSAAY